MFWNQHGTNFGSVLAGINQGLTDANFLDDATGRTNAIAQAVDDLKPICAEIDKFTKAYNNAKGATPSNPAQKYLTTTVGRGVEFRRMPEEAKDTAVFYHRWNKPRKIEFGKATQHRCA